MRYNVRITGLASMQQQISTASEKVKKICEQEVNAATQEWVAGAIRDAPVDQGGLRSAISFKKLDNGSLMSNEIVAQKFYAPFIEFGTKGRYKPIPGTEQIAAQFKGYKGGNFQELLRMITRWVKRKGISGTYSTKTGRRTGNKATQAMEDEKVAFPIALSILKNGIHPHPFFFKQGDVVWPKMVKRLQAAIKKETKVSVTASGDINRPQVVLI